MLNLRFNTTVKLTPHQLTPSLHNAFRLAEQDKPLEFNFGVTPN